MSKEEKVAKQRREITFSEDEDEYEYEVDEPEESGTYNTAYDSDFDQIPDKTQAATTLQNERHIKSGYLLKKGERRRRSWKRRWFVLRGSKLAYYKDDKEYQILRIIDLLEVHAVADVKHKSRQNVFGIVTPKRTFYIQADTKAIKDEWINILQQTKKEFDAEETDGEQADEEVAKEVIKQYETRRASIKSTEKPGGRPLIITGGLGLGRMGNRGEAAAISPSTPSATQTQPISILMTRPGPNSPVAPLAPDATAISVSPQSVHFPAILPSHSQPIDIPLSQLNNNAGDYFSVSYASTSTNVTSPGSALSMSADPTLITTDMGVSSEEDEWISDDHKAQAVVELEGERDMTLMAGWLQKLGRNKTWKKRWFVLRVGGLCYYKNEKEYSPLRVISLTTIIDHLQIDPISKSKQWCFKIVVSHRQYILCSETEKELGEWLDALSVAVVRATKRRNSEKGSVISHGSKDYSEHGNSGLDQRDTTVGFTVSSEA